MEYSVRIHIDRRVNDNLLVTVTLENGVFFPIQVPALQLPNVALGKSYDCDWVEGQFLNVRDAPLPTLTQEQEQRLRNPPNRPTQGSGP